MLLAIPFGLAIGVIVGAVGGGAILALPVLVYVLGEPVTPATTSSLIVVALAAAVGVGALSRRGHVWWSLALTFSAPAAVGSLLGALANNAVSGVVLILTFIPVMLVAAGATWQRAGSGRAEEEHECPRVPAWQILVAGLCVGVLTGFFGVGGGFVIVPALTLWFGVTFRRAVATSGHHHAHRRGRARQPPGRGRRPRGGDHRRAGGVDGPRRALRDACRPAGAAARPRPWVRGGRRRRCGVSADRHPGAGRSAGPLRLALRHGAEASSELVG